jgi:hypothetical protein
MSNNNDCTSMESLRPVLHLVRREANKKTWHVEYPAQPNSKTPHKSADRLGEIGPQRDGIAESCAAWALARTPEPGEIGLSEAEVIYLLPTYQSRLQ